MIFTTIKYSNGVVVAFRLSGLIYTPANVINIDGKNYTVKTIVDFYSTHSSMLVREITLNEFK